MLHYSHDVRSLSLNLTRFLGYRWVGPRRPLGPVVLALVMAIGAGSLVGEGDWRIAVGIVGAAVFGIAAAGAPERTALLVVALIPWSVYPAASGRFSLFLGVPIAGLVAVVMLLAQREPIPGLRRALPTWTYAAFLFIAVTSAALSTDPSTGMSRIIYVALFALFARALATALMSGRMTVEALVRAVVYGGAIAAFAVTAQALYGLLAGRGDVTDWLNSVYSLFGGQRAAGVVTRNWYVADVDMVRGVFPFMAAPSAGQYLALCLCPAVWLYRRGRARGLGGLSLDTVAMVLILVGLGFTFSRQSWIAVIAGIVALGVRGTGVRTFPAVVIGLAVISLLPSPGGSTTFGEYLLSSSDTSTTSSGTRLGLWRQAIDLIPGHALHGVGPGLYGTLNPNPDKPIYYAHNVFLDVAVEVGIPGLIAFGGLIVLGLRLALARSSTVGFAMLVTFAVANLFDDVLYFPRNGLLLAVAFALAVAGDDGKGGQMTGQVPARLQ